MRSSSTRFLPISATAAWQGERAMPYEDQQMQSFDTFVRSGVWNTASDFGRQKPRAPCGTFLSLSAQKISSKAPQDIEEAHDIHLIGAIYKAVAKERALCVA